MSPCNLDPYTSHQMKSMLCTACSHSTLIVWYAVSVLQPCGFLDPTSSQGPARDDTLRIILHELDGVPQFGNEELKDARDRAITLELTNRFAHVRGKGPTDNRSKYSNLRFRSPRRGEDALGTSQAYCSCHSSCPARQRSGRVSNATGFG
jgi:hypothetical protein